MAPRKAVLLLSLLFAGATNAHWIPFRPEPPPEPISDVKEINDQGGHGAANHDHWAMPSLSTSASAAPLETAISPWARDDSQSGQSTYPTMDIRSDYTQLISGSNDSYGCAYGTSNCGHIGRPEICCPDILIISPIQVSIESSCFKTGRSPLGVICCQNPIECERVEHHPDDYPSYQLTCNDGFYECPLELGGGCCPDGLSCAPDTCYETISNDSYTGPLGDDGPSATETDYIPEITHSPNDTDAARHPPCSSGWRIWAEEGICIPDHPPKTTNRELQARTEAVPAYPTYVARYKVRKTAISVLKTGETEICVGPQCPDTLSGLTNGIGQAIQSIAGGSGAALTLTQVIGGIATHIPGASGLLGQLGGSNNTLNIIGALGNALKSDGSSYVKTDSTVWSRTFSGGHLQYMGLALLLHAVVGMRLNHRV
ncbi:hypothetical protein TWF281_004013 [Arthrobotrys megalospora]